MTARDTIVDAVFFNRDQDGMESPSDHIADAVLAAIRGMSHDELRELRPDIAILFDATKDTANHRGDYIINLIVGRLRAVERLHPQVGDQCEHCGYPKVCPTIRAVRGQA